MPTRPKKPCTKCGTLIDGGIRLCLSCKAKYHREVDSRRGKTAERGYGGRWQRYRIRFLQAHPLCEECRRHGRTKQANVVDHIIAHKGDSERFWDSANHQALCETCHNRKTVTQDGGFASIS